ncbi:hypothetical protein [Pseudomonas matsuisoli]|uniref:Lipoprotein n=1 Tax=Pseudomonas matsuisoli TaxID=1515666 RepID=A0A917PQF8_9PSED|nr:hypothetical protein [Pseudomonas matsuisoli]GGJ87725.1 hypothetical protein GCM10009304_11870 [Pseudomonas matsuisoli]
MNIARPLKSAALSLSFIAFTLLTGCASSEHAYFQSGDMGYLVKCGGLMGRWSACSTAAAALCTTDGYEVLARNSIAKASEEEADAHVAADSFHSREMYIQCRGAHLAWKVDGSMNASLEANPRIEG